MNRKVGNRVPVGLQEARIVGVLVLDQPRHFDGANVVVEVRDTSMADAPAVVIARMRTRITGTDIRAIPFEVSPQVERGKTYTIGAEIRRGPRLSPGDLRNVASQPWREGDANPLTIEVRPIA